MRRAYEPELKRQSAGLRYAGSPRRQKFRQNSSPVKLMIILAYDVQGVILCHFMPHGETVNAQYYPAYLQNTYVAQLGVNGHNCKMLSFCMIILLHIRRFVSGICYNAGGEKYWSTHPSHRTFPLVIMI